jgi:glutathione S-transferase
MHAGFQTLRTSCPMNLHRSGRGLASPPAALGADLERLATLWSWALDATGGPWLGGARFSAADVFFAPVATRLESYALTTPSTEPYAARVLGHDAVRSWVAAARAESYRIPACDEIG